MTQTIDPIKLKAAAEHLEWVLKQYPDSEDVQGLLHSLAPLLESAKADGVREAVDSMKIPGARTSATGAISRTTIPVSVPPTPISLTK
ncbi:hypothetical protein [Rhodanobacter lindaniclasticus]